MPTFQYFSEFYKILYYDYKFELSARFSNNNKSRHSTLYTKVPLHKKHVLLSAMYLKCPPFPIHDYKYLFLCVLFIIS